MSSRHPARCSRSRWWGCCARSGLAAPYARAEFEPFAPHGYWAVGGVASLLFFCFAGSEAVTHLAGEFRHPERDLKRATWLTLIVVGLVYIGVVAASVAVLGPRLPGSDVPIAAAARKRTRRTRPPRSPPSPPRC